MTVGAFGNTDLLEEERGGLVAKLGENVVIRRFEFLQKQNPLSLFTTYNHSGNKLCVVVETVADSDEVFNSNDFREFSFDVAMQIAAMNATVVNVEDLDKDAIDRQNKIFEAQLAEDNKPIQSWPKIIEGKFSKWYKESVLMQQESIKVPKKSIKDQLDELNNSLKSNVEILRFVRFELGENQEKKSENLADEVAKMMTPNIPVIKKS
jgi:elongation factor Ts